ncbi:MPN527 family putative ECF transporter permease subunit [Mesomycoplasma lagogenitalium]|uniref:Riboflavin transporter n=1 Tax=Mesomycoplasma lagogenitalium TaxID=171286 RepID=A0ABY8LX28_9BACT|nr:hypothetical protein [Mesomycoplasma lagogenitalium]WGI36821.1 hypothetical protein QEG99_00840 [Mesomycoplasma lagogenitalium]
MNKNRYNNNYVFSITLTGVMLSLALISLFISNYLIWPFGQYFGLKFDLSIIFILPLFISIKKHYGLIALFIRFILGPIITGNIDISGYLGHFILLISNFIYIYSFLLFNKLFFSKKVICSIILAILITTVIITLLNILFFTPLFFYIFKMVNSISFIEIAQNWSQISNEKFNYYWFTLIIYGTFNLFSFSIASIFLYYMQFFILKKQKKSIEKQEI